MEAPPFGSVVELLLLPTTYYLDEGIMGGVTLRGERSRATFLGKSGGVTFLGEGLFLPTTYYVVS